MGINGCLSLRGKGTQRLQPSLCPKALDSTGAWAPYSPTPLGRAPSSPQWLVFRRRDKTSSTAPPWVWAFVLQSTCAAEILTQSASPGRLRQVLVAVRDALVGSLGHWPVPVPLQARARHPISQFLCTSASCPSFRRKRVMVAGGSSPMPCLEMLSKRS